MSRGQMNWSKENLDEEVQAAIEDMQGNPLIRLAARIVEDRSNHEQEENSTSSVSQRDSQR